MTPRSSACNSSWMASHSGAEVTTAPYTLTWDTTLTTNGPHALTAVARDAAGNRTTSDVVSVVVDNPVPDVDAPSVPTNLTATPLSGTEIALTWTAATDNVGVTAYRVARNGTVVATVPSPSYTDTGLAPSTTYTYTVAAVDAAGNVSAFSDPAIATTLTPDVTAPTVSITSPAPEAVVSGQVTVTATAADDTAVVGVQFQVDGQPLGAEVTTAPYTVTWDTTLTTNGPHALTAVARDAAGNRTTSDVVVGRRRQPRAGCRRAVGPDQPDRDAAIGDRDRAGLDGRDRQRRRHRLSRRAQRHRRRHGSVTQLHRQRPGAVDDVHLYGRRRGRRRQRVGVLRSGDRDDAHPGRHGADRVDHVAGAGGGGVGAR